MKLKLNRKEINTMKVCGVLSFLFDRSVKKCSYTVDGNKHWIEFEILLEEPLERQKMNHVTDILNEKIKQLEGEFCHFFLDNETTYSNELNETIYNYKFKRMQRNFLYPYVVVDVYPRVVIELL